MSASLKVADHWVDGKRIHVVGTLTLSGNYVTGGIPLNLVSDQIKSNAAPTYANITGRSSGYYGYNAYIGPYYAVGSYGYKFIPGPNITNGVVMITTGSGEIAPGALPVLITGDSIQFYAVFPKFVNDGPLPLF